MLKAPFRVPRRVIAVQHPGGDVRQGQSEDNQCTEQLQHPPTVAREGASCRRLSRTEKNASYWWKQLRARLTLTLTTHLDDHLATWLRVKAQTVSVAAIAATGVEVWGSFTDWLSCRITGGGGISAGEQLAASTKDSTLSPTGWKGERHREICGDRAPTLTLFPNAAISRNPTAPDLARVFENNKQLQTAKVLLSTKNLLRNTESYNHFNNPVAQ